MDENCPKCGNELTLDEVYIGVDVLRGHPRCDFCGWNPDNSPGDMEGD